MNDKIIWMTNHCLGVLVFAAIMMFNFIPHQKSNFEPEKNKEIEGCEIKKENEEEENTVDERHDLEKALSEPSPKTDVLNIHTNPNLSLSTLSLSDLPPNVAAEEGTTASEFRNQEAADLKIAIKIACLVISVSATAIVSSLAESPNQRTFTITRRLLFKSGVLLMCSSFFLAFLLLILSLARLNFSCLILIARGIMWASAGLMTLSILLLLIFYFQAT